MKKILSLLLVVGVLGYTSCDDETPKDGASPTLTLSSTSGQDVPGAVVSVTVSINAPNGAETLQFSGVSNADVALSGEKQIDVDVDFTIAADAVVGSTITAVITAVDTKGNASLPVEFTITVGNPIVTLGPGDLTTQTLDAATQYLLKGQVFIPSGATLTIPAGTVIKGEKATKAALIVKPGGKLVCNGTETAPVVFTSNQEVGARDKGDWSGIIILGNAYVNQAAQPSIEGISPSVPYGSVGADNTVNENENSGTLTYVRIEYAGIELSPNNETNSLTMGGVGRGTTINFVQASFGGDDGFEWFGGTVDAKHLISFGMWDDDFDTDFGWRGRVQYGLVIRYQSYADQSGSNAFESDSQGGTGVIAGKCDAANSFGCTQAVFSNITVLGPRDYNTGLIRTGETATSRSRAISLSYQHAMHIRRASAQSIFNSVFAGFPSGLRVDDAQTKDNLEGTRSKLAYNVMFVPSASVVGSALTDANKVFLTNIGTGDATFVQTLWTNNNNTLLNAPAGGWSPVAGTPPSSVEPYAGTGVDVGLFYANDGTAKTENGRAILSYPADPNFAVISGTISTGADYSDTRLDSFFTDELFKGAFGATDWTQTWTNFLPLTTTY